eukprot:COSAG02_NODE_2884_length_7815_cov_95.201503_7_plen_64_part_00
MERMACATVAALLLVAGSGFSRSQLDGQWSWVGVVLAVLYASAWCSTLHTWRVAGAADNTSTT